MIDSNALAEMLYMRLEQFDGKELKLEVIANYIRLAYVQGQTNGIMKMGKASDILHSD